MSFLPDIWIFLCLIPCKWCIIEPLWAVSVQEGGERMEFYEDLGNAMSNLSKNGAFLTVKSVDGTVNTMTISWGYVGFCWNKPHFITLVRPQRYTHELIEKADGFTISIPYEGKMKKALAICGSKSGREVDKEALAEIQFAPAKTVESPIVEKCDHYYECKIRYKDVFKEQNLPEDVIKSYYDGDYHDFYFGEIVETYTG